MEVIYVYHSGIVIRLEQCDLLFDYWEDSVSDHEGYVHEVLLEETKPLYILCSHFHTDHFNPDIFTFLSQRENIHYLLSKDIKKRRGNRLKELCCPLCFLKKGDCFEDDFIKVTACGSTDSGISFVVSAEGKTIFHAGDLNNWQWHLDLIEDCERKNSLMDKAFHEELGFIRERCDSFDFVAFPFDPRLGSEEDILRGPLQFLDHFNVKNFCPIHFCSRYELLPLLGTVCKNRDCRLLLPKKRGQTFLLS